MQHNTIWYNMICMYLYIQTTYFHVAICSCKKETSPPVVNHATVDGRNPTPVEIANIQWFTGFYTSQVSSITRRFTSTMLRDSLGILPFIAPDVSATPTPLTTTTTTTATTTANQQIKNGQRFRIRQDLCIIQTHVDSYPRMRRRGMENSINLHDVWGTIFNQLLGA